MSKELLSKIVKLATKEGATEIKSTSSNHPTPTAVGYNGSRKSYKPDMVAIFPKKMDYFAIESKMSKKHLPELISKWILFSLEARKKRGDLYIVLEKKDEEKFRKVIEAKHISAQIMAF